MTLCLGDGYETSVYVHRPSGAARLPVLYVHGIQSHPGWFHGSAARLAEAGHPVFLVTRRGSGDNQAARGDAKSAAVLLDDLDAACAMVKVRTGAEKLHLLGVSWGGKLLAAYACSGAGGRQAASLTMVAPGIVPRVDLRAGAKVKVALALLLRPKAGFDVPLSDVELFTDHEPMREYLRRDGFRLHRATARFLYASRCLDRMLSRAGDGALAVPATLVLASRDRIIDNAATGEVFARLTAGRAVVRELEGSHTLEFEADPRPFYEALVESLAG